MLAMKILLSYYFLHTKPILFHVWVFFMTIQPIRVQFKTACQILDVSRESLRHIVRTDATFPRPIKTGDTKQAPVYFDYTELVEWHNKQRLSLATMEA